MKAANAICAKKSLPHDPTTKNQQGPDKGPQYRSAIFYQNEEERAAAEDLLARFEHDKTFRAPITTELTAFTAFYAAEDYHQDYEARHPDQSYVRNVSIPRLNKFKARYPELLKPEH